MRCVAGQHDPEGLERITGLDHGGVAENAVGHLRRDAVGVFDAAQLGPFGGTLGRGWVCHGLALISAVMSQWAKAAQPLTTPNCLGGSKQ